MAAASSSSSTAPVGIENLTIENKSPKHFILVQYPGIIKNVDKAIETLGGMSRIQKLHIDNRPLELSYHPAQLYRSSIQAERKSIDTQPSGSMQLVLHVRRRRKTKPDDTQPNPSIANIIGFISTSYNFNSMFDFQYLPLLRRTPTDEHFEDLTKSLLPYDLPSALSWWDKRTSTNDAETPPLFLRPYKFSRYNTPSTFILSGETEAKLAKMVVGDKIVPAGHNLRTERKALSVTVNADDIFPDRPSDEALADANMRCKNDGPHRTIANMFEERPMWTRQAIAFKSELDSSLIKVVLPKYAFYILSGPWGRLWCRFGYDPRKVCESKCFQTVSVTLRRHRQIPERQHLRVGDRSPSKRVRLTATTATDPVIAAPASADTSWRYISGQLPHVRQMWYSLCDIDLPLAKHFIITEYTPPGNVASATRGWLPPEALEIIRSEIKKDIKRTSSLIDAVDADERDGADATTVDDIDDWLD